MITEKEYQEIKNKPSKLKEIEELIQKSNKKIKMIIKETETKLRRLLR